MSVELTDAEVNRRSSEDAKSRRFSIESLRAAISLAATPIFGLMALLCNVYQDKLSAFCATGPGTFPLTGMVWMYVLMSLLHAGAWLRLLEAGQASSER